MSRYLLLATLLLAAPALGQFDEDLAPAADSSSDNNTTCDGTPEPSVDEDPNSPLGDWCIADNNNTSWTFRVTMNDPAASLDTSTDAQEIAIYVRSFDEGQSGDPTIRVDIYDGTGCADLHETGSEITLTDAGFPAIATEQWTAAGLSSGADVCVDVSCTKTGGSPSTRNSCDIDALEWRVKHAAAVARRVIVIGG